MLRLESQILGLLEIKGIGPRTAQKLISEGIQHDISSLSELLAIAREKGIKAPETGEDDLLLAEEAAHRTLNRCEQERINGINSIRQDANILLS